MDKVKFSKQTLFEMMNKIAQEREKSIETVARNDGAMNFCKYLLEKIEFEENKEESLGA